MRWLLVVEVAGSLLPSVILAFLFGRPGRHGDRAAAWVLASWIWAAIAWESTFLAALLGVPVPAWFVPVVLGGPLVVSWWRLIAFLRERRRS